MQILYIHNYFSVDNWFQAVRTFECFGVIGSIAVIVFVALYICVGRCSGSKCIAILNVILCLATGKVIVICQSGLRILFFVVVEFLYMYGIAGADPGFQVKGGRT